MLEKELAQATKMAENARIKESSSCARSWSADSEKAHVRVKRELAASRKRHKAGKSEAKKRQGCTPQKGHT